MSDEIAKIHTSCKNCVFAEYKGKTQIGCELGRIENFGKDVVECMDEEKEFFIINRVCNAFHDRNSKWAEEHKENPEAAALKEAGVKVAVIIYLGPDTTIEKLSATCESLMSQEQLPFYVTFFDNQNKIKPADIHSIVWATIGNKITWRIATTTERTENGRVSKSRAVDIAISMLPSKEKKKTDECPMYYTVFDVGMKIEKTFISGIDRLYNNKMIQFVYISPADDDNNGVVCHIGAHQHFGGSSSPWISEVDTIDKISDKLKALAESNNCEHMILDHKCLSQ